MDIPGDSFSANKSGKYFYKYLQFAESLIANYNGDEPFHWYIKKYFASNKKHGSRDRKQITSLCYSYFRLGGGVNNDATYQDKFLLGLFLSDSKSSVLLEDAKPKWNEKMDCPLNEKLKIVKSTFDPNNIFPFRQFLSTEIDSAKFATSFLQQPKLFLRIRPGKEAIVIGKLDATDFSFQKMGDNCLVFSQNEKIDDILKIDNEAVVQDYNSQRTFEFATRYFSAQPGHNIEKIDAQISVWDCCAGSGGKSILTFDILKNIKLTVTDKRSSILQNLKKRFVSAGIQIYKASVLDLSVATLPPADQVIGNYDLIIADVPCSGSGTWSRTPERLFFFNEDEIEKYALLQKNIVRNAASHLHRSGILLYITCSVFKEENEENVDYISQHFHLNLLHTEYLKGYEMQADTLFVAVFKKG
ncbi:MAG: Fmu (Sun) domain-containing protein [Ginsengibacter sp.]